MTVLERPKSKSSKAELLIIRTLNAPKELVFKAFSEADRLEQWWGPKGSQTKVTKLDFKPEGISIYKIDYEGQVIWGRFVFEIIQRPYSIEYIDSFSDANGEVTRAPFSQTWPLEIYNILTLTENEGKTTLNFRCYPINASEEEINTFIENQSSMKEGFAGTFDQLEAYLATQHY